MSATPPRLVRVVVWLRRLGWIAAAVHSMACLAVIALILRRIGHPLELGNVEGVLMDSAVRLAEGQPLYAAPTLEFIPLAYMPGYFLTVASVIHLLGHGLWVGRLVAVGCAFMLATLMALLVRREVKSIPLSISAAGLLLASFGRTGGSMDLVQPNTEMLLLAFTGLAVLRLSQRLAAALLAAGLLACAFFTKQHALLFALAAIPWALLRDRRQGIVYALAVVVFCGGGYALMSATYGPWFSFYTYDVPSHWSRLDAARLWAFVYGVLVAAVGVPLSLTVVGAFLPSTEFRRGEGLWWWTAAAGVGCGLLATLDPYSFTHTHLPVYCALAAVGPIAAFRVALVLLPREERRGAAAFASLLLLFAYPGLRFPTHRYLPPERPHALDRLQRSIVELPGDVWIPYHGFYTHEVGKRLRMHVLALDDILRAKGNRLLRRDPQYFERQFDALSRDPNRPWIVTDVPLERTGDMSSVLFQRLAKTYRLDRDWGDWTKALRPPAGRREAPHMVYAPDDSLHRKLGRENGAP